MQQMSTLNRNPEIDPDGAWPIAERLQQKRKCWRKNEVDNLKASFL
jgi:hypothetical protein